MQDSFQPALFEVNGNKIAFLGCNRPDVDGPKVASEGGSGAAPCDFDYFTARILELKEQGYLVIFTFQWYEDYGPPPNPDQVRDFQRVADAGATIVSGSQAHQPQGMEFLNGSFIHYGLGNLFFDQYGLCTACRHGLIDHHVFYDGRYISTELLLIQFVDYARSRPMTLEEANGLLEALFLASGWQ